MLSTLHTYLASLPAEGTVVVTVLCVVLPVLALFGAGFEAFRAADRAADEWAR
ncbi:hypothetical protein [Methylobacterium sp. SD21]|uniref:hypothetical protein n=1 Tax=Methylobacterium litchii TaxID=3138810 RepID=UPI00313DA88F